MLLMNVRRVKRSGTDYCLSVPLSIEVQVMSTLNYPNVRGRACLRLSYQIRTVRYLVARGNSQGMVKRLRIEPTDATKMLTVISIEFNDYGKLYIEPETV